MVTEVSKEELGLERNFEAGQENRHYGKSHEHRWSKVLEHPSVELAVDYARTRTKRIMSAILTVRRWK